MTIEEVIKATAEILGGINIPVALTEQVAMPVNIARNNLLRCMKAIELDEKKEAEAKAKEAKAKEAEAKAKEDEAKAKEDESKAKEAPEDGRVSDDGGRDNG